MLTRITLFFVLMLFSVAVSAQEMPSVLPASKVQTQMVGNIYPVPVKSTMHIPLHLPEASEVEIVVFDILGAKVFSEPARKMEAGKSDYTSKLGDLSKGQYFVRIKVNGQLITTQRVVVVRP